MREPLIERFAELPSEVFGAISDGFYLWASRRRHSRYFREHGEANEELRASLGADGPGWGTRKKTDVN